MPRYIPILVLAACVATACGDSPSEPAATPSNGGSIDATVDGSAPVSDAALDAPSAPPPPACPDAGAPSGANATMPGAITAPFPTIRNASLEWAITGDANANGVVSVRYRKKGDTAYRAGMPLRRVPAGSNIGFSWANKHSGSLFDLEPATTYEVELYLNDPDGGCDLRTIELTTRAVPAPMANAPVKAASTQTFATVAAGAVAGDVIELAAGNYAAFSFSRDGAAGRPIVIRAASGGGVTIGGEVSLIGRKHVMLTGLTINGRVRLNATESVAVTRCTVNTTGDGIVAGLRSENDYIADNVVTGATQWNEPALGASGNNIGEGILVTGPGHVIEHNKVTGFRDALSLLEDSEAVDQFSIDMVENDLYSAADDGVEADFCFHNCRVVRNRMTNTFISLSSQPGLGGPTYFVRNVAYNVLLSPFKLNRGSIGDVALHNTIIKNGDALAIAAGVPHLRQYFRNNLLIGGPGGTYNTWNTGTGQVAVVGDADPSGDYDYDGFGSTTGQFRGRIGAASFTSLAEMKSRTTEKNAVELGLAVFEQTIAYPANPFPAHAPPDLRLKAGSAAIDKGIAIPNVNDGFAGAAPDLGAYELGAPLPVYGPR